MHLQNEIRNNGKSCKKEEITDSSVDISSNFKFSCKNVPQRKTEMSFYFIMVVKKKKKLSSSPLYS